MGKFAPIVRFLLAVFIGIVVTNQVKFLLRSQCLISRFELEQILNRTASYKRDLLVEKYLVLVGVMTTKNFINTRAKAVYETWAQTVPGKVLFFTSEESEITSDLPVIRLKGIDDAYPPQNKSFSMLKYMHDNYGKEYEFFMRVDDDIHLRTDLLTLFLTSISNQKPKFIGQPGSGTKEDKGKLGLRRGERFCMGGPGIIMNKLVLSAIASNLKDCMSNYLTIHEDVEVWRCVKKYAKIDCTKDNELKNHLYHNEALESKIKSNLSYKDVLKTITLHPIKNPTLQYWLYIFLRTVEIQQKEREIVLALHEMKNYTSEITVEVSSDIEGYYSPPVDESIARMKEPFNILGGKTLYNYRNTTMDIIKTPFYNLVENFVGTIIDNPHKIPSHRVNIFMERNLPGFYSEYILEITSLKKRLSSRSLKMKKQVGGKKKNKIKVYYGFLWVQEVLN